MLLITHGALYKAPVHRPQRVLDLGTGTGIWPIDYATDHPEAEVIGLDLRCVACASCSSRQASSVPLLLRELQLTKGSP